MNRKTSSQKNFAVYAANHEEAEKLSDQMVILSNNTSTYPRSRDSFYVFDRDDYKLNLVLTYEEDNELDDIHNKYIVVDYTDWNSNNMDSALKYNFKSRNVAKYGSEDDDEIARNYREGKHIGDCWCLLNSKKYMRRFLSNSNKANNIVDLRKAHDYLTRALKYNEKLINPENKGEIVE
jgi:hypothetical protein